MRRRMSTMLLPHEVFATIFAFSFELFKFMRVEFEGLGLSCLGLYLGGKPSVSHLALMQHEPAWIIVNQVKIRRGDAGRD